MNERIVRPSGSSNTTLGAEVGQQLGAVRAGRSARQVDDAQTVVDHDGSAVGALNIGTITDWPGTVENVSGRNVDLHRLVGARAIPGSASTT